MSGSKMLLFGGSFDPPHNGHMNLLQNAIAAVRPDAVMVIPSGTAPHKHASATPGALRAAMCECFRPLFPALEISDIELGRTGKSYTSDTLEALKRENPDDALYLCIGGDMLESFTTWHRWRDILAMATLVAAPRLRDEQPALERVAAALRAEGGRVLFSAGPVVQVSSSQIRRRAAQGLPLEGLVPPPADAIIRQNSLYQDEIGQG